MNVFFLPDWRNNPYQQELAKGLAQEGVISQFDSFFGWSIVLPILRGKNKIDVLHIHWTHPFLLGKTLLKTIKRAAFFLLKLILCRLRGIKIIWTVHNLVNHEKKFSNLHFFYNRSIAQIAQGIIVHSHYAKEQIVNIYRVRESKVVVIPHGHYINSYPNEMKREEARQRLQVPSDEFIFLYFGVIREYKGIPALIRAFQEENFSNARLIIVGNPINDEIQNEIEGLSKHGGNIQLIFGFIPDEDLQVYMNASDMVVLPYKEILTSGALLLAMSFGVPLIASLKGSMPEVLDDQKGGFLYEGGSHSALCETLKKASVTEKSILGEMGQYNLDKVKTYDWKSIAIKTKDLYRK